MKRKSPSLQFYPGDWRRDAALQSCSIAARGLWIEMICLMHDCEPYGHMVIGGVPLLPPQIARLVGLTPKEFKVLLMELESAGVLKRTAEGAIYSIRMVRDEELRKRKAKGGEAGAEHGYKGGLHGIKGGRPRKLEGGLETPLEDDTKPPTKPPPAFAFAFATTKPKTTTTANLCAPRRTTQTTSRFNAVSYLTQLGVSESEAREWLLVRSKKRKANTERAIRPTVDAAASAGRSLASVISLCIDNSWAHWSGEWSSSPPNGKHNDRQRIASEIAAIARGDSNGTVIDITPRAATPALGGPVV